MFEILITVISGYTGLILWFLNSLRSNISELNHKVDSFENRTLILEERQNELRKCMNYKKKI